MQKKYIYLFLILILAISSYIWPLKLRTDSNISAKSSFGTGAKADPFVYANIKAGLILKITN